MVEMPLLICSNPPAQWTFPPESGSVANGSFVTLSEDALNIKAEASEVIVDV